MSQVILVTGTSSGFGAMSARALVDAGHIVYATMRDTAGRNAPQVEAVDAYAKARNVHLRAIDLDVQSQPSADSALERIVAEQAAWTW
jgi:NAD(P)-dependent dehydrogenase (short-subunit alcohol dehydrogenase family)